jgi:hypothetical protein
MHPNLVLLLTPRLAAGRLSMPPRSHGRDCLGGQAFASPEVVSGFMADEVTQALIECNPLIATIMMHRGLFGSARRVITKPTRPRSLGLRDRMLRILRRDVFDYFGRKL